MPRDIILGTNKRLYLYNIMFEEKQFLMIPGPTPVPSSVLAEIAKHPLPHRSKEFSKIFTECNTMLKQVAKTEKAVPLIYACSGTGVMEASLVNVLSPGDKVVSVVNGVFSKRWADMAEKFGAEVIRITVPDGEAVTVEQVKEIYSQNTDAKLLLTTFSETSTGVKNPIKEIAELTQNTKTLFAIDAITGLGAMPLYMDDWGIDIVISGSQKGFMIPPGLGFMWVSEKALAVHKEEPRACFYWDWTQALKALDNDTTAFTPNVNYIVGLHKALSLITTEGIENTWARHQKLKNIVRKFVQEELGFKLLVTDENASAAITSVVPPENISVPDIRKIMKEKHNIIIANGQRHLQDKIFRLGHLGYACERDINMALACLKDTIQELS